LSSVAFLEIELKGKTLSDNNKRLYFFWDGAMAIRDVVKVSRKTFFNPRAWVGADELKYQFSTIVSILKDLFSTPLPAREETFEQALVRLNIAEEDLDNLKKRYWHFCLFFVLCFFIAFAYAFFLLFAHHSLIAFLLALAVSLFFVGQAFRFHFWQYQLQVRRLGVTFAEWKNAMLGTKE
jgi:intracellular multiplication protein IcmV